jgi:hypothetical protein
MRFFILFFLLAMTFVAIGIAVTIARSRKEAEKPEERLTPRRSFGPLGRSFALPAPDERRENFKNEDG